MQFKPPSLLKKIGVPYRELLEHVPGAEKEGYEDIVKDDVVTEGSIFKHAREILRQDYPLLDRQPTRNIPESLTVWPHTTAGPVLSSSSVANTLHDVSRETNSSPYRLYRFVVPQDPFFLERRNLAFIGMQRSLHTMVVAQAQALWIAAFFDNCLPQLEFSKVQLETALHTEYQRMRRPKEAGGSGSKFPDLVFDSMPYVDLLLQDLGMKTMRKSSFLGNVFLCHSPRDYCGLVQEWTTQLRLKGEAVLV